MGRCHDMPLGHGQQLCEILFKGTLMLSICITPHLNIPILSIPFVYDSTF